MRGFLDELRRRNVIRVAGLYLAGAWLLLQIAGTVLPILSAPEWMARSLLLLLAIVFVPVLVFAWVFEWTPQGLVREVNVPAGTSVTPQTGKWIDRWIMLVLAIALGYFAFDKFVLSPQREAVKMQEARQEGRSEAIVASYGDRSIAVLPFRDMSKAKDQSYFSEGIAEQLLNLLTRLHDLRVTSRASAFSFAGKDIGVQEIARQLNVSYVLDGSIRTAGKQVRVSVQLIDARSDTQLWARTFDRSMQDIFAIQDEIAAAVVENLKVQLLGDVPKTRATNPQALRLYLRSLTEFRKHTPDAYRASGELARKALEIDPEYVDAWNMLAVVYSSMAGLGMNEAGAGYPEAEQAARKALSIAPDSADALSELAIITLARQGDLKQVADYLQRALALEPANIYALGQAATLTKSLGRLQQTVQILKVLVERDPLMANPHSLLCLAYYQSGKPDAAISECRTALALKPDRIVSHATISVALLEKGDARQALAEAELEPFEPFRWFGEAMAYHSLGEHAKSDAVTQKIIAKYAKDAAYNIAYVEAWRGNVDSAFEWLEKAVEYQDSGLPMIAADPILKKLAGDPRWLPFLRKLGKAPEQLQAVEFNVTLPQEAPAAGS